VYKYIDVRSPKSRFWYVQVFALIIAVGVVVIWLLTKEQTVPSAFLVPHQISVQKNLQKVIGMGKITPCKQRFIAAPDNGQIVELFVRQGQEVQRGTPILRIENLSLEQEEKIAGFELSDIKSDVELKKSELGIARYQLESNLSNAQTELDSQKLSLSANELLVTSGIVSKIKVTQEKMSVKQAALEVESRNNQLALFEKSYLQQIKALDLKVQSRVEKQQYFARRLEALTINSDITGSIRNLALSAGESVVQGQNLAELIETKNLVAEVQIPQYSVSYVSIGDTSQIITPNGILSAKVEYIDSVIRNGGARVFVTLDKPVPSWLKIDQSVEVTIETNIEQMEATLDKPEQFDEYDNWTVYRILDKGNIVKTDISLIINPENTLTLNPSISDDETVFLFPTQYANHKSYPIPEKKFNE
jgi:multidrug resistance efflux pump